MEPIASAVRMDTSGSGSPHHISSEDEKLLDGLQGMFITAIACVCESSLYKGFINLL